VERVTLKDARDYFERVVNPNYQEFIATPGSFRTAFNMALSLFNMRDWVFVLNKADAERVCCETFATKRSLWDHVQRKIPEARSIRDVANASKHVVLDEHHSTSMTHIANTSIASFGYGEGTYGVGRFAGATVVMAQDGEEVSMDKCAAAVFEFWERLLAKFPVA